MPARRAGSSFPPFGNKKTPLLRTPDVRAHCANAGAATSRP